MNCTVISLLAPGILHNAGAISGGTSVNTIAQECSMLYEARSDEAEALVWNARTICMKH